MKLIAGAMLSIMTAGIVWAGSSLVNYNSRIAVLEARDISQKDLILRVDRKVDKVSEKIDKILEKVK